MYQSQLEDVAEVPVLKCIDFLRKMHKDQIAKGIYASNELDKQFEQFDIIYRNWPDIIKITEPYRNKMAEVVDEMNKAYKAYSDATGVNFGVVELVMGFAKQLRADGTI